MENNFKFEIISPEKIIFSDDTSMLTIPSFEGEMTILKDHIPLITFLRPGIIKAQKKEESFEEFFVEDGTVEFFNNTLILLSASVINLKNLSKEFLDNLTKEAKEMLNKENITDQDRYILNHKIDIIKEIRI